MNPPLTHQKSSMTGLLAGLLSYLWWGMAALYWGALQYIPATDLVAHRAAWSVPFCALVLLFRGHLRRALGTLRSPRNLGLLAICSVLIAFNWGLFIWSIGAGRLAEASLGYFMQPLVAVLIGMLFFGERLSRVQWISLGLAVAGVLVFVVSVGHLPLIALGVSVSFAIYGALRRSISVDSVDGLFIETLLLLPLSAGWLLWRDGGGLGQFGSGSDAMLLLAGAVTAIPLIAYVVSARHLPMVTLGMLFYLNPSCQLLLAAFWFGEPINHAQMWSFGLVWSGLAIYLAHTLRAMTRQMKSTDAN